MSFKNAYRTHRCAEPREDNIGSYIKAAGWIENIRDHGGVIFLDLRDDSGILQAVIENEELIERVKKETVVSLSGKLRKRSEETKNPKIATGMVELMVEEISILCDCINELPFEVRSSHTVREDVRLKYRFLDLRNPKVKDRIKLRSKMSSFLRRLMEDMDFLDIQTPILSASSPEGARDYLTPSRKHPGKFYALPQAPQLFKQLLMVSGFDRYYQIAPCFRDEDARADRSPGEFYQLDFEAAFATQDDILNVAQELVFKTFSKFSDSPLSEKPFERISYHDAMLKYGTDKPDLRNPLEIIDVSDLFIETEFKPFRGKCVRALPVPGAASQPRSFFEKALDFATEIGMKGLGYFKVAEGGQLQGPIDKFLTDEQRQSLLERANLKTGDLLYFIADSEKLAPEFAGQIRTEIAKRLNLIDENIFKFCFIVDVPMYEKDKDTGKPSFLHNPFSAPKGGEQALSSNDPFSIIAWQYDLVCNGVELGSGAVRNHNLSSLYKAFEIAGYTKKEVDENFSALCRGLSYGAPPHAGMALGIERMAILLTGADSIREVTAFPMNANAQDLLTGAPSKVNENQLREVHIKLR